MADPTLREMADRAIEARATWNAAALGRGSQPDYLAYNIASRRFQSACTPAAIIALDDEVQRLRALVYVPGLWRCAKCQFTLLQSNLNSADGSVTARDKPGDKCPNCDMPLWRVTERDAGNEMVDRCEAAVAEAARLRAALLAVQPYFEGEHAHDHPHCVQIRAALEQP